MGRSPFWNLASVSYVLLLSYGLSAVQLRILLKEKKKKSSEKKGKVQEDRPVHAGKSFTS